MVVSLKVLQRQAGVDPDAIDEYGACSALAVVAPLFRSGQAYAIAQEIKQRNPWLYFKLAPLAIYFDCDWDPKKLRS